MERLTSSDLRVLNLLMSMRGTPKTRREMARQLGWSSATSIQRCLSSLSLAGLVSMEHWKSKAIKVTCRFVPASEL